MTARLKGLKGFIICGGPKQVNILLWLFLFFGKPWDLIRRFESIGK